MVFGGDFCFMNAKMYFGSIDKLIPYFNAKYPDVTIFYSTPSNYVDAISQADVLWPTKYDDFFPYAEYEDSVWTGYFTSRPTDKEYIRKASHNLATSSQLYALSAINQKTTSEELEEMLKVENLLLDSLGVNQHHDAVTGTAKQHVANDYVRLLFEAMEGNNRIYADTLD